MILDSKQTTVAYRCPYCGAGIMSAVGLFTLSADMIKLKCDCGHSEMTVIYSKDGKVRLTVPCIFCPKPHSFTVNSSLFFGKDLFLLACPYSDINICFIGDTNHVKAELARTELELLDILEENGISGFSALHGDEEKILSDPQIFDIIMFVIHDLEAENKIFCRCPPGEGEYDAEVLDDAIRVKCKKCGASRDVPTDSLLGAHAFLNCDSLHLE
jgi:predicted RNA-binding Zn-ribbon protein involved in translation (DUF1610 family)